LGELGLDEIFPWETFLWSQQATS